MTDRRLRLGMVGGGAGSFIGGVHRMAARLDDQYELVAGALSSDPERARHSAAALHIEPDRAYADYETMAASEAGRSDRIDVVSVVTPNDSHAAICHAFLSRGIPVICDKPLCTSMQDARSLAELLGRTGLPFVLTHNYTGYPLVREARARVLAGELGTIRVVQVEYPQEWLAEALEQTGQKQAAWRTDPARSGPGGSVGDIGTHAHQLAGFVTGLRLESVAADLSSFVPGRRLDDDARMLLRYEGGARGMLWCSQVAPGCENGLRLRVFGDKGGLEWLQAEPNVLHFSPLGQPTRRLTRGMPGLSEAAANATRIPAGHPEGYLEAFAQIYTDAAALLRSWLAGTPSGDAGALLPGIEDGLRNVAFIDAVIASHKADAAWTRLEI
ncbi:Gfo/Idh/MocA family protein [Lichenicola sp.]|uniref:Gfo/Idh/MocA family protein n=1 Tax=Lichenicola sp. TaxID=2804529 RepID=UPI003B00E0EE